MPLAPGNPGFSGEETYDPSMAGFDEVGAALALLRKRAGLSQEDVSAALGLRGPTSVSAIETGNPRADTIQRYLVAVKRTPADLVAALADLAYAEPAPALELREGPAADPLDRMADAFNAQLRALVEEVKRRSPKG